MGLACCCTQPFCPAPGIRYDSIGASKTAPSCYFNPFVTNPDLKLKKRVIFLEETWNGADVNALLTRPSHPTYPSVSDHYGSVGVKTKEDTSDYSALPCDDPDAVTCDGPGKGTYDCDWDFGPSDANFGLGDTGSFSATIDTCTNVYTPPLEPCASPFNLAGCSAPVVTSFDLPDTETLRVRGNSTTTTCEHTEQEPGSDESYRRWGSTWFSTKTTTTLSEPYTIADLKAEVLAALPAFDDDFDDSVGAFYNRSGWTVSARKAKPQIYHAPSQTGYLRVAHRTRFSPKGGGASVPGALEYYVWEGSPPVPSKPLTHIDNQIMETLATLDVPSAEGTLTREIVWYSCVRGYTPGEGDPNGFPPQPEE